MSRTLDVIRNRNKVERESRQRKREEIARLRHSTAFSSHTVRYFEALGIILEDPDVDGIVIEIDDKNLANFGHMLIDSNELSAYDIKQVSGSPNKFLVKKKYIKM